MVYLKYSLVKKWLFIFCYQTVLIERVKTNFPQKFKERKRLERNDEIMMYPLPSSSISQHQIGVLTDLVTRKSRQKKQTTHASNENRKGIFYLFLVVLCSAVIMYIVLKQTKLGSKIASALVRYQII